MMFTSGVETSAGRRRRGDPRAGSPPPSRFQRARDPRLEGARGRGPAVRGRLAARAAMGARHGPARRGLPDRQDRSRPSRAASCRISPASTPSSRRPMSRTSATSASTTRRSLGIPFDSGTTYRPGTRFGPQGIRRISALYTPYNYELGVDLREQMTLCDAGDVFTIPANLEKSFDQITPRRRARLLVGRPAADARRRPFDRLSLRARHRRMHVEADRHHPFRPPHRHPGEGSRRAHAHHALVLGDQPAERLGRRISSRSASAAGRCRATASPRRASARPTC